MLWEPKRKSCQSWSSSGSQIGRTGCLGGGRAKQTPGGRHREWGSSTKGFCLTRVELPTLEEGRGVVEEEEAGSGVGTEAEEGEGAGGNDGRERSRVCGEEKE